MRLSVLLALLLAAGGAVLAKAPRANHPILGTWKLYARDLACVETETYEADGHHRVTSGAEVALSEFDIAPEPSSKGYCKLVDTIIEDNGKPDCGGSVIPVGDVATVFIRIENNGEAYLLCLHEDVSTCMGVAHRQSGSLLTTRSSGP